MQETITGRDAVVNKTSEMMRTAKNQILGMGRTIAWVEIPNFEKALSEARNRLVNVRVLAVKNPGANKYFMKLEKLGARLRYFDHGDIRIAITDHTKSLIAFPRPAGGDEPVRDYMAIYTEDEEIARWLEDRFFEFWEVAEKRATEANWIDRIVYFSKTNFPAITVAVIGALVGAIATVLLSKLTP